MKRLLALMCLISSLNSFIYGQQIRPTDISAKAVEEKVKIHDCKKPIIIAVLDTGFDARSVWNSTPKLCKFGHKDFTGGIMLESAYTKDPVPEDDNGHGTHIAGLIDKYAKQTNNNYCLVILKYYKKDADSGENFRHTIEAIKYATSIHADFINYSGGGTFTNDDEISSVKAFIDRGGTFVAAAGNEASNIDFYPYYPAEDDDRVIAVANGKNEKNRDKTSNYGKRVNRWEDGHKTLSTLPGSQYGYMTGTSQAAAIATGKIVAEKNKYCK